MADDDFEIDLYGENEDGYEANDGIDMDLKEGGAENRGDNVATDKSTQPSSDIKPSAEPSILLNTQNSTQDGNASQYQLDGTSTDYSNGDAMHEDIVESKGDNKDSAPDQSSNGTIGIIGPIQQGVKRKESHDERPIDPGASSAITVNELNWWVTDDDVRGWAKLRNCEEELKDITFSEHKVNGKSKGQVYVEFESPQAATALKHHIEGLAASQPSSSKYSAVFSSPATNPFKTLPRNDTQRNTPNNNTGARGNYNNQTSFRGGNRGGRGAGNMNNAGVNNRGGYQGGQMGNMQAGYGGPPAQMGGYGNAMGGGFQNNFANRGAMMGGMRGAGVPNRGGRGNFGGMPNNMMGGMNMGAMGNMGNMGMMGGQFGGAMGMNGMAGFGGQGHFNPAFFQNNQQQLGGGNDWNPHGAKRPRPE